MAAALGAVRTDFDACCRCDAYGNVVALHAKGDAVCSFDVDHIFPWSRGGLSVPVNLMAVYWGANRHVKVSCCRPCLALLPAHAAGMPSMEAIQPQPCLGSGDSAPAPIPFQ